MWLAQHISRGRGVPRRLCGRHGEVRLRVYVLCEMQGQVWDPWSSVGAPGWLSVTAAKVQGRMERSCGCHAGSTWGYRRCWHHLSQLHH